MPSVQAAVWSTAYINTLPDSAFLHVESGGKKDEEGKTVPRTLRHFPYKDDKGKIDLRHLRNAIAQIPKAKIPNLSADDLKKLQEKARRILEDEKAKAEKTEKNGGNVTMTTTNEELVQKAVITAADALATSGKLNPIQSDKFIDYVIDETVMRDNVRIVKFSGESLVIDKIGLGQRSSVPVEEAIDPSVRRGVTTSKVTLTPKEIMTPWEIGDTFREVNIEKEKIDDHIAQMMARQTANDVEQSGFNGDLLGPAIYQSEYVDGGSATKAVKDGLWALYNGWSRAADSGHVKSYNGTNVGTSIFFGMIREMPTKFRRNMADLRWFMSPDLMSLYYEKLATRGTSLGDIVVRDGVMASMPIAGVKAVAVPLWDLYPKIVEHVTLTGTTAVSLRYKPIQSATEIVTLATLDSTPTTPYVEGSGNDYIMNYTTGTIVRDAASTIPSGSSVKVTYYAYPQVLLTHKNNLIFAMSRDVRIEKDRDIFRRVNQYAITTKVDFNVEETDALVKGTDIGVTV